MPEKRKPTKAALLLVAVGKDLAARILRHMKEDEAEKLALEIATLRDLDEKTKANILEEFISVIKAKEFLGKGGIEYAKDVLEKAYGPQKAKEILERLLAAVQVMPFEFLRKLDGQQIANLIQNEHPQTIALVMNYLKADQAAIVFTSLPPNLQAEVAFRMAVLERTSPDIIQAIEEQFRQRFATLATRGDVTRINGIEALVKILNSLDQQTQSNVLNYMDSQDPELAEEVRKRMFTFDDIILLDDKSIQRILREVDTKDLALALKAASEQVKEKVFKNMSQRAREMLQEEMEFMGPVRLRQVEEAQAKIITIIRRLEEAGEIIILRGGEEIVT
ncbi:flagellar motor switch protein FliG [Coprothermobacteraceae bacterium]|nr:flagellar motor switch protein FliG [Coprothermobacteraceae bacterium]